MRTFWLANRLLRFHHELGLLWRAFRDPAVPLHLKALMLLVPLYLLSPIDLIPDFIPVVGLLDDLVIVPLLLSAISGLLARHMRRSGGAAPQDRHTIDGTWRRH